LAINYLDGYRLLRVLRAGTGAVCHQQKHLNKINVFPVADGDTGTNLVFTLTGILRQLEANPTPHLGQLAGKLADAALEHAKGNSGVIMAQFFYGLANKFVNSARISLQQFAEATQHAVREAYGALANPQEGTLLTVLRHWSIALERAAQGCSDFKEAIEHSLSSAQQALADTPKQLAVLQKAGVVDAAGKGFVVFMEGIQDFIRKGKLQLAEAVLALQTPEAEDTHDVPSDLTQRYCTEFLLTNCQMERTELMQLLNRYGDSTVVTGGVPRYKVHLHTNHPGALVKEFYARGVEIEQKIDDMYLQQLCVASSDRLAIAVDSGCDLPPELMEEKRIYMLPLRLHFGDEEYLDKVTLTEDEFYDKLRSSSVHPQTSQPPPGRFKRFFSILADHHEELLAIHVPGRLSGTLQNAVKAMEGLQVRRSQAFDSLSLSVGIGLLALEAAEKRDEGYDLSQVVEHLKKVQQKLHTYIAFDTLDAALRGGRVSVQKKWLLDMLNLNPVMQLTPKGEIGLTGVTFGKQKKFKKFEQFLIRRLKGKRFKRIGVAHASNPMVAKQLERGFRAEFPEAEIITAKVSAVLGVHGGLGAIGVAFQEVE